MRTAAIIIARGGSRRLPRKNVKPLCGLPLVAWSIIQSKCSHLIDDVYLSTDDDELEAIGRAYGAEIIRRPDWPDADEVAANRPFLHALAVLEERAKLPDRFMSVLPTSPLRKPDTFDEMIRHHDRTGWHVHAQARLREVLVFKDVAGVIAKGIMWDKSGKYMQGNSGLGSIVNSAWYLWYCGALTELYGDLDATFDNLFPDRIESPDIDSYYVTCETWQCVETDTLPEFELAEVLMEHYILQGRGRKVYDEYARAGQESARRKR